MDEGGIFFGWKVVGVAFVIAAFGAGVGLYGPSILLQSLHASRGWPVAIISAAITAHFVISALIIIFLPDLHRRVTLPSLTILGVSSCGVGIIAWASAAAPWELFVAAIFTGIGWASTSSAAINAIISRWFDRERPKALSMALNGAGVGGVLFAPLWVFLISHIGLRLAALSLAIAMIAVIAPLARRFLSPAPIDLGLSLDGRATSGAPTPNPLPSPRRSRLLSDKRFVTLSSAFALGMFAQIGLLAHMIQRLSLEFSLERAAVTLSLITGFAIVGRTSLGWILTHADRRFAGAVNFLIQAIGVSLLATATGTAAVLTGCLLFGLTGGNLLTLPPLIAQVEFDRADQGKVIALAIAINQGVMAFGPAALGLLHDSTGGYQVPFTIAALLEVAAALILLAGRQRAVVTLMHG